MAHRPDRDLTLRAATSADRELLLRLAGRLAGFDVPHWRTADEIASADARAMFAAIDAGRSGDEVLVAERGGAQVGCLHMIEATDFFGRRHAHLSVIAVDETAEGTGVGSALMSLAEDWARRRRLTLLTLNVFDANIRARRLYERAGFAVETLRYAKVLSPMDDQRRSLSNDG